MGATPYKGKKCSVSVCDRVARARGLCVAHWQRLQTGKPLDSPVGKLRIKQGWIHFRGYRWVMNDEKKEVLEHRYLMEQHLGRKLLPTEIVHHKNGVRHDNRLDNLQVMSNAEHVELHHAHRNKCLICEIYDPKGSHGLCSRHAMHVWSFIKKHQISRPAEKIALSKLYMGIAMALNNTLVEDRIIYPCSGHKHG